MDKHFWKGVGNALLYCLAGVGLMSLVYDGLPFMATLICAGANR